jgi:serine/threonine protein kinase
MIVTLPSAEVRVGDYVLDGLLAWGGTGAVFQARDNNDGRLVALKLLGSALTRPTDIARFQREANTVARLDHPGIVPIYAVGQDEQLCYLAMELVAGVSLRAVMDAMQSPEESDESLEDLVSRLWAEPPAHAVRFDEFPAWRMRSSRGEQVAQARLSEPVRSRIEDRDYIWRCCEIIRDAARALAHAHDSGVVHRDVKPENLMLECDGRIRVVDFGVAAFLETHTGTHTSMLPTTPMYMSPEQICGQPEVDSRTDVYSLGMVLYELLTLRPPLTAATPQAMMHEIVKRKIPPVRWANSGVNKSLESVVHRAMAKDPGERYQSAEDFADDLDRFLNGEPVEAGPYRYRLERGELASERPGEVLACAWGFLFIAVAGALMKLPAVYTALGVTATWRAAISASVTTFVLAACGVVGCGLLSGFRWARWSAMALAIALLTLASYDLHNCFVFLSAASSQALALRAVHLAPLISFAVTAILFAEPAIVMMWRRRVAEWFHFAHQLRQRYRGRNHSR